MAAWMRPRTSALSIRHTPNPTAGIRCPLLSVTAGAIVDLLPLLLRCPLPAAGITLCPLLISGATSFAAILSSIYLLS